MQIVTRKEAKDLGLKRYFPNSICIHGHNSMRLTSTGKCDGCYKSKPKLRALAISQDDLTYYTGEPCPQGHVCERRTDSGSCVMCANIRSTKDREGRILKSLTSGNLYYFTGKPCPSGHITIRYVKDATCFICNYEKSARRRALKLEAMPKWVDKSELSKVYTDCPHGMHVDHIIPLQGKNVRGLHVPWNLQYLTPTQNMHKGNRLAT